MNCFFTNHQINEDVKIFFLCGTQYVQTNVSDKRNVLKKFIVENVDNAFPIILEENFTFKTRRKDKNYLVYDDIFLRDLKDIETLTGLFVDAIFIIHESEATAAELGLFAANESLYYTNL